MDGYKSILKHTKMSSFKFNTRKETPTLKINGVEIPFNGTSLKIEISGDFDEFGVFCDGSVKVVSSDNFSVKINGNVETVKTQNGIINCGDVGGNIKTEIGNVTCKTVNGNKDRLRDGVSTMNEIFERELLDFHLPETFKSLTKQYILECIFNEKIQDKWIPQEGDIIVGCTGNVFTIGTVTHLAPELGGDLCLFNPTLCNRDGGVIMDSTHASTFNEDGLRYEFNSDAKAFVGTKTHNHGAKSDFRFVPYPHELQNYMYD